MQQQPASKCTTRRIRLHRPHHHQITSCVSLRPHSDTEMPKRPVFSDSAAKQAKKQASKKSKGMRCQPLATASFAGGARRAGDGHTQRDWHGADCWLGQGTSCVTLGALQPFDSLAIGRVFPSASATFPNCPGWSTSPNWPGCSGSTPWSFRGPRDSVGVSYHTQRATRAR